jgi:DNA primase
MKHQDVPYNQAKQMLKNGSGYTPLPGDEIDDDSLWFPPAAGDAKAGVDYMAQRGISYDMMCRLNIYFCGANVQNNNKTFYTANRVIIPIMDRHNEPVSWQGRDITGDAGIKYLFPPGFKGAEHLYNIQNAQPQSMMVVCEGVFDAFGWIKAGVNNVVATFGKKISEHQLEQIVALGPTFLMLAWDSDAIDQKYEFYERYGHLFDEVRLVELHGRDADELDANELISALRGARRYSWEDKILAGL